MSIAKAPIRTATSTNGPSDSASSDDSPKPIPDNVTIVIIAEISDNTEKIAESMVYFFCLLFKMITPYEKARMSLVT